MAELTGWTVETSLGGLRFEPGNFRREGGRVLMTVLVGRAFPAVRLPWMGPYSFRDLTEVRCAVSHQLDELGVEA